MTDVSNIKSNSNWLVPIIVLAVGTFAMGTDSFVLAGILPQLADGLGVSLSAAGQVVTVFALTYAIAAPVLAALTGRVPRKRLMAIALAIFVLANLASALSSSLTAMLASRVVAAIGAALFTPSASAAAAALAGPAERGRAMSVVLGGLSLGTVFGVPIGTMIGHAFGWQASLLFVTAVSGLALVCLLMVLPQLAIAKAVPLRERFKVLVDHRVMLIVAITALSTAAGIMVYTYIAEVLGATAGIDATQLPLVLLVWGAGGAVGSFGSGWLVDRFGANRTLLVAMSGLAISLATLASPLASPLLYPLMAVYGATGWAVLTPNNHRLTGLVPNAAGVAISFNSSGVYLGQALGAVLGGLSLAAGASPGTLPLYGAGAAMAAVFIQLISLRLEHTKAGIHAHP